MNSIDKLRDVVKQLNKTSGSDVIRILGDNEVSPIPRISTGSYSLDAAIGGGLPKGKIIEIYGGESSGKTTVCLEAVRECQKEGGAVAFVDYEQAFDPVYAKNIGVDVDNLVFAQPDFAEQGLDIIDSLIDTGELDMVVIDSVAAMVPKVELEGEMGDQQMGVHARIMSKALRKITAKANKTGTTVVFINQTREKIGVMFGSPETTTGGNALKFYASLRLRTSKSKGDATDGLGNNSNIKVTVTAIKNKTFPPHRKAMYYINFGEGIDTMREIIDMAVERGIIKKSGSWYSYGETRLGQGANGVKSILKDNPELVEELKAEIENVDLQGA